jgi:glycosyltransferase involved in cell wall biosynthesis
VKILHCVENYHPSIGGAQEVVKQLSEHMVMQGHSVTVATSKHKDRKARTYNGVRIQEFTVQGNAVKGLTGEVKKYQDYVIQGKFDVVMIYAAQQWSADALAPIIKRVHAKTFFVPCGFSGLHRPSYSKYYQTMPEFLKSFSNTIYMSTTYQDYVFATKHGIKNTIIIQNGVDEREFDNISNLHVRQRLNIPDKSMVFLSIGNHNGQKGHKEAIKVFSQLKKNNCALVIVGGGRQKTGCYDYCTLHSYINKIDPISKIMKRRILTPKLDRKETLSLLIESDMFWFFSNIEASPLVLHEAAAVNLPFISSDVGNAKEIASLTPCSAIVSTHKDKFGYASVDVASCVRKIEEILHMRKNQKSQQYLDMYEA